MEAIKFWKDHKNWLSQKYFEKYFGFNNATLKQFKLKSEEAWDFFIIILFYLFIFFYVKG